ncbi:MAG: carboxypeptidase regulatory-like domain-containing protein [Saprospiraceae bacterium]|nr:carboxypeptidase regulatory-like domain-containing protein [Candidatus Opimibacter iunctus]
MRLSIRYVFLFLGISLVGLQPLSAQLYTTVDHSISTREASSLITIRWSAEEERKWHDANDGRLDIIGLRTNIHAEELKKSKSNITTYSFDLGREASIELMMRGLVVAPGEELYLYDSNKDSVIFDLGRRLTNSFLSAAFDPSTTVLVWKCGDGFQYKSQFVIEQLYFQPVSPARVLDIGFGTAFACHPNAACKQDSMMKLISSSTVRIKLVMQEGIGWCSGSFVNNTRNDKTPYLLTAFHCQYNFTPLYDMWRFDFQYASTACTNPVSEPQYFSLTGCSLIASGQESDFLLVLLEDQIPINQEVTFAGWDRDDTAKPDTSYLIHHPNADIRKISTCINPATIHPNQIGWTEGYTTPAHHHFRLKFTEGGHEPGSSGGPLFNQDGYLVGQLHGGTAGCEATNNAYIGRLAKSWNLGVTPQGRLRDWLDPDQTGQVRIPSIRNINAADITDIHGLVTDPEGNPVKNVMVKVTGSIDKSIVTSDDGTFNLIGVNRNGQYTVTPEKKDNPTNGLNALDLVAIQKHLLGKDTFDFEWQFIAADATNNNELSVGDIVVLLRLLLGKIQVLPSSPSWRFDPPQMTISALPQGEPTEVQFMGIKIGDLNGTADPKK